MAKTSKPAPHTIRVVDAVLTSELPSECRFLVMVMAHLANHRDGRGFSSQRTIARAMGKDERTVRRLLAQLEKMADSPVQIERRPRFRPEGRGRTSDEYRLRLTGHQDPVDPVADDGTNRTETAGLTGHASATNRTPMSGDPVSDPVRDPGSIIVAPDGAPVSRSVASKQRKKNAEGRTPEQRAAHKIVVAHYVSEFERKNGEGPSFGPADGKFVYDLLEKLGFDSTDACRRITNAFLSTWLDNVTIRTVANNPDAFLRPPKPRKSSAPVQPSCGTRDWLADYAPKVAANG